MTLAALPFLLAAMTSADAVQVVLNSSNSVGVATFQKARAMVEREAAEGKPLQQFVIGVTTEDPVLAKRYLNASREKIRMIAERNNNALAWYLLSMEANDFKLLQRAADGENVQALNAMGAIATSEAVSRSDLDVMRVERILKRSYDCFRRAAKQRDAKGFVNLGTCYLRGLGCKQDMAMAFRCFQAAAELGHPEGMDNVSACYQFGHGIEKNDELSLFWAMRGRAVRGNAAAAKWLKERR